jgi:hypothetical protein
MQDDQGHAGDQDWALLAGQVLEDMTDWQVTQKILTGICRDQMER